MTIDKAIVILNSIQKPSYWSLTTDDKDAIKLGVEALKRIKRTRDKRFPVIGEELLGEDTITGLEEV